jgi:hypothetical protein
VAPRGILVVYKPRLGRFSRGPPSCSAAAPPARAGGMKRHRYGLARGAPARRGYPS